MQRISYQKKHSLGFFSADEYEYLGSISGYQVWKDDMDELIQLEVVDPNYANRKGQIKRVASIELSETKRGVFEVALTIIDKEYQGLGLAPRLYAFLLRKLNITLQAGSCQSPGGRSIWRRLAKRRDVMIYGKTAFGRPVMMIEDESGDLAPIMGNFDAYDGDRDYFMYAVRAA